MNNNLKVTKKKDPKTLFALITIIILFLFLLIISITYFNSPRRKFISNFTKIYNELFDKSSSNKLTSILNNNIIGVNGETVIDLKINDELVGEEKEMLEIINSLKKIELSYDYKEDKNNKIATLDFDSKITDKEFIKFNGMVKDNKLYFNLKNLLDKYFYTDSEFTSLFTTINEKDTEYVLNILKDVVIKKVTSEYFSSEKLTININQQEQKVEKISLKISNQLIKEIVVTIIDELKSDEKAMNILVEYNKIKKEEITELFNSAKESFSNITSNQNYFYNMYVKGSETLKHEFIIDTTKIEYITYENIDVFKIIDGSTEMGSITLKHENNQTIINGNISSLLTITGNYSNNKLNLVFGVMGSEIARLDIATTETIDNNQIDSTISAIFILFEEKQEMFNISINSKNTIKKENTINKDIPTSSINANNISEEDKQTIINNLMELPLLGDTIKYTTQQLQESKENQ